MESRHMRGVTLVELIVVMALIGLMLSMAAPSVSAGLDGLTLTAAGRRVVDTVRLAQLSARRSGERLTVVFDGRTVVTLSAGRQVLRTWDLPASIKELEPAVYVVYPSGQVVGPDRLPMASLRGRRGAVRLGPQAGVLRYADE